MVPLNSLELPLALFAFFGFVGVVPVWMWYISNYSDGLPTEVQFLAQLVLPATVALFLGSWIQRA